MSRPLLASGYANDLFQGICRGRTCVATSDHSDIRGLVTDKTCLRRGAAFVSQREFSYLIHIGGNEDSPYVVLTPHMPWMMC